MNPDFVEEARGRLRALGLYAKTPKEHTAEQRAFHDRHRQQQNDRIAASPPASAMFDPTKDAE